MTIKRFELVDFIMSFESGEASDADIIEGFQYMINDGIVWGLQGLYGRTATDLIDSGICKTANIWSPQEARENYIKNFLSNH